MNRHAPRSNAKNAAALLVTAALGACAIAPKPQLVTPAEVHNFTANYPADLQRLYVQVPLQGHRNAVVNYMRAGLAALDEGALDAAATSFDEALKTIELIYAENPNAEQARSLWFKESAKDFKGEPYERAMAYYYRGIIYGMQGDYQNARASFRGGLLQDTFIEENLRIKADFGAMSYLEGWAGRCAGFDAATVHASFSEAIDRNAALVEPPSANKLLAIFETGTGPVKFQDGKFKEILRYSPGGQKPLLAVSFQLGKVGQGGIEAADLFYKASTRGGRPVDAINEGKVVYKEATETGANVAKVAGAGLVGASLVTGNKNAGYAGLGLLAIGLIAEAASNAMKTEADARQWDNLPGNIMISSFPLLAAGQVEMQASYARNGVELKHKLTVYRSGTSGCAIAWGREFPANAISDTSPYTMTALR